MAKIRIKEVKKLETNLEVSFQYETETGEIREGRISPSFGSNPEHIKWMIKEAVKQAKKVEVPPEVEELEGTKFDEEEELEPDQPKEE